MDPLIQQHWGNGERYHSSEDVRTADRGQTVIVQLRDGEGFRYGTVRMTREAALTLAEYLVQATAPQETAKPARRRRIGPIDATPALQARAMGREMTMMAVPHDISGYTDQKTHWEDIRLRAQARLVIKRMVEVYMSRQEEAYWTDEEIRDLLDSLPAETVDVFTALPGEDIEHFFRECVNQLRAVQRQIDLIAA